MKSLLNGILISLFSRPHPHIILLNLRRVMTTIDSNEHTLILLLYRLRSRIRINSGSNPGPGALQMYQNGTSSNKMLGYEPS